MKHILFSILFFPLAAFGQDSATYTLRLDTFGLDSFFLVETRSQPQSGLPRAIETEYPIYMTDTAQLSAYIVSMRAEYDAITAQVAELSKRKAAWDYRYNRVICLRDSVFYGQSCGTGIGSRTVKAPSIEALVADTMYLVSGGNFYFVEDTSRPGFWVAYDSGGFDWISGIEQAKSNGTILHKNGTTANFRIPKANRPKKPAQPKKKKP